MIVEDSFDVKLIPHSENHWDIVAARYEEKMFYIEFQDGTSGAVPVSEFPELDAAIAADFDDLEVSPCGLILENERIEWDYAEAGLYKIVKSQLEQMSEGERAA
ncbi:MAG: DUF2442 domain-containing protein [Cyanobacteria bacterium J06607_13]